MTPPDPWPTCSSCKHWLPQPQEILGECALGWEAHDQLPPSYDPKTRQRVPVTWGHGGLLLPPTHPDHKCAALVHGQIGWKRDERPVPLIDSP